MHEITSHNLYRCDLCRGAVDADTRERARQAWQPLIICERCIQDAEAEWSATRATSLAAA